MIDYCLKFADLTEAKKMLAPEFIDADGNLLPATHDFALNAIENAITHPTGKTVAVLDSFGVSKQVAEKAVTAGYHVNLRLLNGDLPKRLVDYVIAPLYPKCIWSGDEPPPALQD